MLVNFEMKESLLIDAPKAQVECWFLFRYLTHVSRTLLLHLEKLLCHPKANYPNVPHALSIHPLSALNNGLGPV